VSEEDPQLTSLLEYVKSNDRVCPMPVRWTELWQMLPDRQRHGSTWVPPQPMIVAEWWSTPSFAKMERLAEQIRYAHEHGGVTEVDRYLRGLPEAEWAHLGEFLTKPAG
jgi:hypothetical protein